MKNIIQYIGVLILFLASFTACNLEKEVEIVLPAYERQYVVECYLEPGKPFNLLLTKSSSYFDSISLTYNIQKNTISGVWIMHFLREKSGVLLLFYYQSVQ